LALGARLELRQGQGLVITPQLQQAIKLLQLSNLELEAFVEAELERNPLLSRDESDNEPERESDAPEAPAEISADAEARADLDTAYDEASPGERATGDAPEPAADVGGAVDWSRAGSGGSFEGTSDDFESALSREQTLAEHLHDQLAVARLSGTEAAIASVLIDGVDEGGYLRLELPETA